MNRSITWFEIPVSDLERAARFYETVFRVSLSRETVADVPHAIFPVDDVATKVTGALVTRAPTQPGARGTVVYLVCENVDAALDRAVRAGGKAMMQPTSLPGIGTIAAISDLDGNVVGLHAFEAETK